MSSALNFKELFYPLFCGSVCVLRFIMWYTDNGGLVAHTEFWVIIFHLYLDFYTSVILRNSLSWFPKIISTVFCFSSNLSELNLILK